MSYIFTVFSYQVFKILCAHLNTDHPLLFFVFLAITVCIQHYFVLSSSEHTECSPQYFHHSPGTIHIYYNIIDYVPCVFTSLCLFCNSQSAPLNPVPFHPVPLPLSPDRPLLRAQVPHVATVSDAYRTHGSLS